MSDKMGKEPLKIVVLGGKGAGKTTILQTLIASKTADEHGPYTMYLKNIIVDNVKHQIEFVDARGYEEYLPIMKNEVTNADGILMVFGLNCKKSFLQGRDLLRNVWEYRDKTRFPVVIVGTKTDIPEERVIPKNEAYNLATSWYYAPYREISAFNKEQVMDVFVDLVRNIISPPELPKLDGIQNQKRKKNSIFGFLKR